MNPLSSVLFISHITFTVSLTGCPYNGQQSVAALHSIKPEYIQAINTLQSDVKKQTAGSVVYL